MKKKLLTAMLFFVVSIATSQAIKNDYIVTLKDGTLNEFVRTSQSIDTKNIIKTKVLSKDLNIIEIFTLEYADKSFEEYLDSHHSIESWAYNHPVEKRKSPNDQYFEMQWALDLVEAKAAWEVTTGGLDYYDTEIVVAVLDESYDLDHPELENNIFINTGEIPDDGIDNDNNGYIDDYQGWNTLTETDNHPIKDEHGNAVCGIIGAEGDNSEGISGVNWNLKVIPISGISTQAEVIGGYQYAITMRRRFNESNGNEGAFVVATNYSAGIANKFGTDPQYQAWCNMYDAMGQVGILSAGATDNADTNVDLMGDIPTTCESEFLISVTNVDITDTKVDRAAYGATHIDLGAPGEGILALDIDGGYVENFGGTSAATPHVAGAVALLYSLPCKELADLSRTNPSLAAREVKTAILNGTEANTSLNNITVTGGRLSLFGAMEEIQSVCEALSLPAPKGELELSKIKRLNGGILEISYVTPDEETYNILVTDRSGKAIYRVEFTPPSFGRKVIDVPAENIITGIYFISIYNDSNIKTEKIYIP